MMRRSDFAVFILTHGRANLCYTTAFLKKRNYTGRTYYIIDDEDNQADEYRKNFGDDNVIVFDKRAQIAITDTMDTLDEHRAIVYARNKSYEIAKDLGLKYFLMFDDDYDKLQYRFFEGGMLRSKPFTDLDSVFDAMLDFLDDTKADIVAFGQAGDYIGGIGSAIYKKKIIRKAMNSFFCKTENPVEFRGTMNEDVTLYTTLGSRGKIFLTVYPTCLSHLETQSLSGGMTDAYLDSGTYLKTFYSVLSMPSAVTVSMMSSAHARIHHRVSWEHAVPCIINEKWRKLEG